MKATQKTLSYENVNRPPIHYGFLVMPGFSLIAYAAAIDTLRLANKVADKPLYTWETFSVDGKEITASNGLGVSPKLLGVRPAQLAALFVCGGVKIHLAWSPRLGKILTALDKQGLPLGAMCTGAYILAKADLLNDCRCTIHWERLTSTREEFPKLNLSDDVFELDKNRYTCAGGTTPIDMMLALITREHGKELAASVSEVCLVDRIRNMNDHQRIPLRKKLGTSQPRLTEAVALMESNIEEPLSPDDLAGYVSISRRQLERLFRAYLQCTPTQYYLGIRLRNARLLLLQTEKSIVEISLACGFASTPHFSKCYRDLFGLPPREERRFLLERETLELDKAAGNSTMEER